MTALPDDPTLDEVRAHLAPLVARNAAFDGWRAAAVDSAAAQAGIDPAIARLAFDADRAGGAAIDMIEAWFESIDTRMFAVVGDTLANKGMSARITTLIEARLTLLERDREALRRALAVLALPQNLAKATKLGWRTADRMWRAAGDTATDYNHYTKRLILSAVYTLTITTFLDDESEGFADTRAFLARRIAGVGRFEKAKAKLRGDPDRRISLSRFIGRLRYPAT